MKISTKSRTTLLITLFIIIAGLLGVFILQFQTNTSSHAAQVASLEAETFAAHTGTVSISNDVNASNGQFVQFGAVTPTPTPVVPTSTNTPTPSPTTPPTPTFTPSPTPVGGANDPVVFAAGDIACGTGQIGPPGNPQSSNACWQFNTASLLKTLINTVPNVQGVLELGDIQYPGTYYGDFAQYYGDANQGWGDPQILNLSRPVPGNHDYTEYSSSNPNNLHSPAAYLNFFGSKAAPSGKTYYSYNVGSTHLIALDSDCTNMAVNENPGSPNLVNCTQSPGSDEISWMKQDIAQFGKTGTVQPHACMIAYWHHPAYTSWFDLVNFNDKWMVPFWQELVKDHADLILNGHAHMYERFLPVNPVDNSNTPPVDMVNGIPEIIAGIGGRNLDPKHSNAANEVAFNNNTMGVLQLTLHANSLDYKLVPDPQSGNGTFTDSGTYNCH